MAAELLAALGHDVVEAAPAWPPPDVLEIFINVFGPAIALGINSGVLRNGREPGEDEIEPLSRALFERARATPSIGYLTRDGAAAGAGARPGGVLRRLRRAGDAGAGRAAAARSASATGSATDPLADLARSGMFTPYTALFNITGQPAISLPVGFGADGLPTGVQFVGKPLNEDRLLQLALQIEAAHPWAHHRPVREANRCRQRGRSPPRRCSASPGG